MVNFLSGVACFIDSFFGDSLMDTWFNLVPILLIVVGLFVVNVSESRKWTLIAYLVVCGFVFMINIQFWPLGFALSKFLSSVMTILILNLSPTTFNETKSVPATAGIVFRVAMLAFGFVLILFVIPGLSSTISLSGEQLLSSLFILVTGLVLISLSGNTYRTVLGLLLALAGFEILYGAVERSLLVNGMLAAIDLLVALVGSYLMINSIAEVDE